MSDKAIRNALRNARNVAKKPKADVDKYQKRYMRHIERTGMADGGAPAPQPNEMGFYSHGAYSAANLPQAKGTPQQFRAALEKQGVKPDEFLHTGWDDAFANRPSVTREEVAEHFTKNAPQINERVLRQGNFKYAANEGGMNELAEDAAYSPELYNEVTRGYDAVRRHHEFEDPSEVQDYLLNNIPEILDGYIRSSGGQYNDTKYQKYLIPGGENYREMLLKSADPETLPSKFVVMGAFPREFDTREEAEKYYNNITNPPEGTSEDIRAMLQRKLDRFPASIYEQPGEYKDPTNVYESSHWRDPNILAHLRMSDRTGPNGEKILHVEEIQSDWAQEGRERGFHSPQYFKIHKELDSVRNRIDEIDDFNSEESRQLRQRRDSLKIQIAEEGSTPLAPYVDKTDKWVDFALKRVLSEAAQGGYDGIAITPGSEQSKRYKLSRPVSIIQYFPTTQTLKTIDEDGAVDLERRNIKPEEISKHIGKQMANSLLSEENAIPNKYSEGILLHELRGEGMSIGGEGMRSFYDNIVPNQLNKMVQKMDKSAKVRMSHMPVSNQHDRLHYLPVTDAMREKIQRGLPTFAEGGVVPRYLEKVHKNPSAATIKNIAKNSYYEGARMAIDHDGNLWVASADEFLHRDLGGGSDNHAIMGFIRHDNGNYSYTTLNPETYSSELQRHPRLDKLEQSGIPYVERDENFAKGGEVDRLDIDKYPTHYMPEVGRQVMADGGESAKKAFKPDGSLKSDKGYIYHGTNLERAEQIAREGMRLFDPSEFTEQDSWPDGSTNPRAYFSRNAGYVHSFLPEEGEGVVLRAKEPEHAKTERYTNDVYVEKPLPPHHFEVLNDSGEWEHLPSFFEGKAAGGSVVGFAGPDSSPSSLSSTPTTSPSPPMLFFKPSKKEKIKTNEPTRPRSENSSVKKALMLTSSTLHGRAGRGTPR